MKTINKEDALKKFYDTFQLGVELEGSFTMNPDEIADHFPEGIEGEGYEMVDDGSVDNIGDGYNKEMRSKIIRGERGEKTFIKLLKTISSPDSKGEPIFALRNTTAGTHVHLDFNPANWKGQEASGANIDYRMLVFDSLAFERFFFNEYFKSFNKEKFASRLRTHYCKPFIPQSSRTSRTETVLSSVEQVKERRDRYFWLNTECLLSGKGIEIRIFPYLQTAQGVAEVINFTKRVIAQFWEKPRTQKRAEMIKRYYDTLSKHKLNLRKLNDYEKILVQALAIQSRQLHKHSSDSIEFLIDLYNKKPSAFESAESTF